MIHKDSLYTVLIPLGKLWRVNLIQPPNFSNMAILVESFTQLPFPIFEDQKTSSATQIESGNLLVQRNMMKHPRKIPVQRPSTIIKFIRHSTENYPKSFKNPFQHHLSIYQNLPGNHRVFSWIPAEVPQMCGRILSSTSKRCHSIRKPCIVGRAAGSTTRTSTAILGETTPRPAVETHQGCLVRWYLWTYWWSQPAPKTWHQKLWMFFFSYKRCETAHWAETGTNEILF